MLIILVFDRFLCLISGCQVRIYSVGNGEMIYSLNEHTCNVVGAAMKNENTLVSCDESGKLIEWDVVTGKKLLVVFVFHFYHIVYLIIFSVLGSCD